MCAGAIINSRIHTLRYGTRDDQAGCCGSVLNQFEERFNHHPRIYQGALKEECEGQLSGLLRGAERKRRGELTPFTRRFNASVPVVPEFLYYHPAILILARQEHSYLSIRSSNLLGRLPGRPGSRSPYAGRRSLKYFKNLCNSNGGFVNNFFRIIKLRKRTVRFIF